MEVDTRSDSTRGRENLRMLAIVLGVALMVGIPLSRLSNDGPTRFGWHMYSHGVPERSFVVVTDVADPYEIDIADHVHRTRADLPLVEFIPPHLCETEVGAKQIVITVGEDEEIYTC